MGTLNPVVEKQRSNIAAICKELKIKRFYIFGSVLTDTFSDDSDIDILISFIDNISVEEYANNYFLLHYRLKELFNKEVDVVTERTLTNPYLV